MNGVAACLLFGAPFCVVFNGVGRPNCYVPRQHVPSIIQATVPVVPDLSFVLYVLTGDGDPEGSNPRDIRVRARGGGLCRISDAHCAYDPLHFVLFHPHGKPGWHPNITGATLVVMDVLSSEDEQQQPSEDEQQPDLEPAMDPGRGGSRGRGRGKGRGKGRGRDKGAVVGRIARKIAAREYASYFMHDRNPPTNSTFTYGKRLYQEWVVDKYSKVEVQRLRWVRLNQTTLRVDQYKGMVDAMQQDEANSTNFGHMVVLPASFAGSLRHMNQL